MIPTQIYFFFIVSYSSWKANMTPEMVHVCGDGKGKEVSGPTEAPPKVLAFQ